MILVAGEALIDFFATDPRDDGALGFVGMPGGSPFNVAVGLARLGRPVAFLARLSRDSFGRTLDDRLAAEGVDRRFICRGDQPSTLSFVTPGPDGSPDYVFLGQGAADRSLTAADLPASLPPAITALHIGSFSLAVEPSGTTITGLAEREAAGRVLSVDANVRPRLTPDMAALRRRLEQLAGLAGIVKASAEDIGHLYGTADLPAIARHWADLGARLVLITDGADGAYALAGDQWHHHPTPPTTVIDTVGAGDTFQAAILAALDRDGLLTAAALSSLPADRIPALLALATRAAALTCGRRGPDLPRAADLNW